MNRKELCVFLALTVGFSVVLAVPLAAPDEEMDDAEGPYHHELRNLPFDVRFVRRNAMVSACPPTEPFMCPGVVKKCISLGFVCDGSPDCPDGYDEHKALCSAAKRPPVQETATFFQNLLKSHGPNFFEKVFGDVAKNNLEGMGGFMHVAVALSGSPTINDFGTTTNMSPQNIDRFRKVLLATESGDTESLHGLGISDSELADIKFFLDKLIETGFATQRR